MPVNVQVRDAAECGSVATPGHRKRRFRKALNTRVGKVRTSQSGIDKKFRL